MKSRFTENEPWLKIPVEKLTWDDLPKDEADKSAAIWNPRKIATLLPQRGFEELLKILEQQ